MGNFLKKQRKKNIRQFRHDAVETARQGMKAKYSVAYNDYRQDKYNEGLRKITADNFMTIWAYVLNRDFGYGHTRMTRFFKRVSELADCVQEDWSPMSEWTRALREEAGFDYHCMETKTLGHDIGIVLQQIDRLNVIFTGALFVEFGFHGKRLGRCFEAVKDLSASLKGNPNRMDELDDTLRKKKIFAEEDTAA